MSTTSFDDDGDDEDWYDDSDDDQDDESVPCPECGESVYAMADRCPACGYWITDEDGRQMWTSQRKPMWVKLTAVVLLVTLLYGLFGFSMGWF
jgi:hypothetical protein